MLTVTPVNQCINPVKLFQFSTCPLGVVKPSVKVFKLNTYFPSLTFWYRHNSPFLTNLQQLPVAQWTAIVSQGKHTTPQLGRTSVSQRTSYILPDFRPLYLRKIFSTSVLFVNHAKVAAVQSGARPEATHVCGSRCGCQILYRTYPVKHTQHLFVRVALPRTTNSG